MSESKKDALRVNITQQKRSEAELARSEIRFSQIVENAAEGILVADVETKKFAYANRAITDMLGYSHDELLKLHISDLHPKEELDAILAGFDKTVNKQKIVIEVPCLKKDGSKIYVQIQGVVVDFQNKQLVGGFFSDITEKRLLQEELVKSEKKYRELYENAPVALYRTRISDGKLLECNHALATLLGYESKEQCLSNHYPATRYTNPTLRKKLLSRLKEKGSVDGFEIEFIRCDGTHAWVKINAKLYPEQGYIEGSQIEITASKVLTPAEKKILGIILQGKSNKEIAEILSRSVRTIEDHRAHIMQKLGANSIIELVKKTHFLNPK